MTQSLGRKVSYKSAFYVALVSDSIIIVWEGQVFGTGQIEVRCGIRSVPSDNPIRKDPRMLDGNSEASNSDLYVLWWVVLRK
jgi:hypothetical protein